MKYPKVRTTSDLPLNPERVKTIVAAKKMCANVKAFNLDLVGVFRVGGWVN